MPYTKRNGQVFTPRYIVEMMLDFCGYKDTNILCKHLMDNSCGDGAFLCSSVAITKRYLGIRQQELMATYDLLDF